jgi:hypothetical protein
MGGLGAMSQRQAPAPQGKPVAIDPTELTEEDP